MRMQIIVNTLSIGAIAVGAGGGLGALPLAFSRSMTSVVGAGFVFIAGALLIAAGLVSLSKLSADTPRISTNNVGSPLPQNASALSENEGPNAPVPA